MYLKRNFIITVQVKTIFHRLWQITTSQSNESHLYDSFSHSWQTLWKKTSLFMVNLAAESFECSSGNATHHKASPNSDLMQQRTFSQLPRVTGTVSDFTWGRIIKMLKCQMTKAPVVETKQSLCWWSLRHSHSGQDSLFLGGWGKDWFTAPWTGILHLLPLSSNKDTNGALTLYIRNGEGQNLFNSKHQKIRHLKYDN